MWFYNERKNRGTYKTYFKGRYGADVEKDENAGFTFMKKMNIRGRKPYLFG